MSDKDTGGSAFPTVGYKQSGGTGVSVMEVTGGMTLRDYFAAKAMQVITQDGRLAYAEIALRAYYQADAMLEARKSGG